MRTINSLKNIIAGTGGHLITILLQFISRTVFINILGVEYLGISALFTNILQILNMTELGIGSAIIFSLYKPLSEGNEFEISAIMKYLRKAYYIIGLVITLLGIGFLPFIPYVVKGLTLEINLYVIFILYLTQTVSSYWFFSYKSLILQADQKNYKISIIRYLIMSLTVIMQIAVLYSTKSFVLYLVVGIFSRIITNIAISLKVDKIYPYIKVIKNASIDKEVKKNLLKNIFGVSMYKFNSTIVRSTDNVVISTFISTVAVGMYSNYHLIVGTIITVTKILFSSFTASIGNLLVTESKEKSEFIFKCISFFSFWIYGFSAIALWILIDPFIILWIGKEFILDEIVTLLIIIDFLMDGYQQVVITYKDASGLFWKGRYRPLATAILNIIISVILAPRIGIAGVILGTIISRFLTTWWFEPRMVYKFAFNMPVKSYFERYLKFTTLIIITGVALKFILSKFLYHSINIFIIKIIIVIFLPNLLFYLLFRNNDEFKYILNTIKRILKGNKKK